MNSQKNDPKSLAMNIAAMLIFGTIGVVRRQIPLSSGFLAFTRGILGGLTILAFMKLKGKSVRENLSRRQVLWLSATGAIMGINWILLFEAFEHTTVAVATLCYYMQPTIVILLSPLVFREKLSFLLPALLFYLKVFNRKFKTFLHDFIACSARFLRDIIELLNELTG